MPLAPGYTDLATLKLYLDKTKSADDAFLTQILASAEAIVEQYTRRQFHPDPPLVNGADTGTPVTKTFSTHVKNRVRIRDLREATSVKLGALDLSGEFNQYDLGDTTYEPSTSIFFRLAGYPLTWGIGIPGVNDLVIAGRWGWNPPPPDILDATYTVAARMFKERDANYADSVIAVEGVMMRYTRQLPARAQETLNAWKIPNFAMV